MSSVYQEDFIWSIRQRRRIEEHEDEDDNKRSKRIWKLKFENDTKTQIKGSMVPDEILMNVNEYAPREYTGCLLYGDIFGFVDFLEHCNQEGKGDAVRITKVLNDYIGGIMGEIMGFQGDILRFSSDYFMVLWKCTGKLLKICIHAAINCALVIQKKYGQFTTDEGIQLNIKLSISAGPLIFSLIGDMETSHFVCVGPPVDDIKETEERCEVGDILVAPSAWMYVDTSEYRAVEVEDGAHFKVLGIGVNWKYRGEEYEKTFSGAQRSSQDLEIRDSDESFTRYYRINNRLMEDITIRPIIIRAADIEGNLGKFMLAPLINTMNADKTIEALMEIRQVVIMFVNIITKKTTPTSTVRMINECYYIISQKLKIHKGVISKISLFDKDMIFLIIFGLRGLENTMECREALTCSFECQQKLQLIEEVQSVSIACTTGKSYCGIFGHSLRRDYGFIGMNILKAAKMVAAYPDKVTCDRQTFIYSKLNATNFTVLQYKKLRGIPQHGLMYAYSEQKEERTISCFTTEDCTNYPILGREDEVKIFQHLFGPFLEKFDIGVPIFQINCIVIEGRPMQGKTRLLNEFVYVAKVPVNRITFLKNDFQNSYNGVRTILAPVLNFEKYTLNFNRQQKLKGIMKEAEKQEFLCALNDVFDVNFPTPEAYKRMTQEKRFETLKYCICYICSNCFAEKWLISLDNAELMDEESWSLTSAMLETKSFFLVIAINQNSREIADFHRLARSRDAYRISLKNLSKKYHAGLACQILGTHAIPVDLENALQRHSNGNPGWIENSLITLLQSKKIYIQNLSLETAHTKGLVVPPLYMQKRMSPDEIRRYRLVFEEKSEACSAYDRWEQYVDCCSDKTEDVDVRGQFYRQVFKQDELPVCFLSKSFNANHDIDPEVSIKMNTFILYDGMPKEEQYLLMCASILGDPFTRRNLLFIWGSVDEKLAGDIIQSLFEKRILCCARGDFSGGGEYILLRESTRDQSRDKLIECYCIGLDILDTCLFLPKYASCGFLRFRSDNFRETVYNLVPETQKRELHARAAKFIQKETRRCIACGCTHFQPYPSCKLASTPAGRSEGEKSFKKKSVNLEQMDFEELFDYSTNQGRRDIGNSMTKNVKGSWSLNSMIRKSTFFMMLNDDTKSQNVDPRHARSLSLITPFTILKLRECVSLVRTFSQADFVSCECHLIVLHMYRRLRRHYKGSAQWFEMLISCLHYVKICIMIKSFSSAKDAIEEALDVLDKKLIGDVKWKLRMLHGKIYSYQGIILLKMNQIDEACKKLIQAMEYFGYNFTKSGGKLAFELKLWGEKWRQKMGLYFFPEILIGDENDTNQLYTTNSIAETLCYLSQIYIKKGEWKLAELAAVWSLRNSLESENSLIRICESFVNMLIIAQHHRNRILSVSLEVHALRYCHKKKNMVEAPELRAIAQLYTTIFEARYGRTEFDGALHLGYVALNVARASNESNMAIRLLTNLAAILLERLYMQEVITVMHELEYFAEQSDELEGMIWYYAMTVGFHLRTGYMIVPFDNVEIFFNSKEIRLTNKHGDARMRLIVVMWVWFLRNERWEAAALYKNDIEKFLDFEIENSSQVLTALFLLEGELLTLVNQIDKRTITGTQKSKKKIEKIDRKLRKSMSSVPFICGRLYHLEAFYAYILSDEDKMRKLWKKGMKFFTKYDMKLGVMHMEHSEKAWSNEITAAVRDFWKNHCTNDTYIPFTEMDYENLKIHNYTYPKPIFEN